MMQTRKGCILICASVIFITDKHTDRLLVWYKKAFLHEGKNIKGAVCFGNHTNMPEILDIRSK